MPGVQLNWERSQKILEKVRAVVKAWKGGQSLPPNLVFSLLSSLQGNASTNPIDANFSSSAMAITKLEKLAEIQASRALSELIGEAADTQPAGSIAHQFLQSLRLCGTCNDFERVGGANSGGYIMCADGLNAATVKGVYSYGINGQDGWGMEMASKSHAPLYEYDCFNTNQPTPCTGCEVHFFPECLKGDLESKPGNFKTLTEQMARNSPAGVASSSLLLKVDIEGNEYPVFAGQPTSILQKFRHINTEFHAIAKYAHEPQTLQAIRALLDAGFAVAHIHGNNYGGMVHFGPYSIPSTFELTLIPKPLGTPCANHAPVRIPEDAPCNTHVPELPNSKLP